MKKQIKSIISLFVICAVIAVALAFTNHLTKATIAENERMAVQNALSGVMPGGSFSKIEHIDELNVNPSITEIYHDETTDGYVFKINAKGYSTGLVILCGVNADGTVSGATCLDSKETNKAEVDYGNRFVGLDRSSIASVDTVSGSTKTTAAYRSAIQLSVDTAAKLRGGNQNG